MIDGVEVFRGAGNVFAALGLPDTNKLKIKTGLVVKIREAIHTHGLTLQEAVNRMGIPRQGYSV